MRVSERSRSGRRAAAVTLAAALVIGGWLVAGGAPAASKQDKSSPKLIGNALVQLTGAGNDPVTEEHSLFYAKQRGQRMGIIAILIGLVPEQDFALRFSRKPCSAGAGGFAKTRRQIPFTSSPEGHAHVERQNLGKGLIRRTRSVVVVSPETGNEFQGCGALQFGIEVDGVTIKQ